MDGKEQRMIIQGEMRIAVVDGNKVLTGYAARFNQRSEPLGGFVEEIAPGAFANVLAQDVRALFNHDPSKVLGRTTNGTLRLAEDQYGLRYDIDLPDTPTGAEVYELVRRGDVSQSSFTFDVDVADKTAYTWQRGAATELPLRIVRKVRKLYDIAPVTMPAYPQTSVQARDLASLGMPEEDDAPTRDDDTVVLDAADAEARARQLDL
jgi:uncharacterized protein